jgi:hypothetical protein
MEEVSLDDELVAVALVLVPVDVLVVVGVVLVVGVPDGSVFWYAVALVNQSFVVKVPFTS